MTIHLFGGEMGMCAPSDANVIEGTSALGGAGASHDSGFARCYIGCTGSTAFALTPVLSSAIADFWLHIDIDQHNASSSATLRTLFEILDGSGSAKLRLQCSHSSDIWELHYHNGSAWTLLGNPFTADGTTRQTIDVHIVCNSTSGSADLYMSGTNRVNSGTVDFSSIAGLSQVRMFGNTVAINGTNAFSQIVIADESTIGMRVGTIPMTGAGATDQWDGTWTDVDDVAFSDADFASSDVAGEVDLYAGTPVPSFSGYTIRAVAVTARVKKGSSGPTQVQLALRSGGTTWFSGSRTLDLAYGAIVNVWEADPDTSAAWLSSDIAALQYGLKSIA